MAAHHAQTQHHLRQYLDSLEIPGFDVDGFFKSSQNIGVGVAVSGGGYRSMLTATGMVTELDDMGLFAGVSYITGVSGGSWLVLNLLLNDFESTGAEQWELHESLLEGIPNFQVSKQDVVNALNFDYDLQDDGFYQTLRNVKRGVPEGSFMQRIKGIVYNILGNSQEKNEGKVETLMESLHSVRKVFNFYKDLHLEVRPKRLNGFHVSFTDYWGRALVRKVFPKFAQRADLTLSSFIETSSSFASRRNPFPIIVANCKNNNARDIVFEFTPYEFGSWDSRLDSFVDIKYLGSQITGGRATECFQGFDNIGYIAATSSSLFNNVIVYVWKTASSSSKDAYKAIRGILSTFGLCFNFAEDDTQAKNHPDYALFKPNPFYKLNNKTNELITKDFLYLVDGGEDGENIPLRPLLHPERSMDIILCIDSSSDMHNYPDGTVLRSVQSKFNSTSESAVVKTAQGIVRIPLLPDIPAPSTFSTYNLLERPVFFGCHLENYRTLETLLPNATTTSLPPIIVYYANSHHTFASNVSTFQLTFSPEQVSAMIDNGRQITNMDNDTYYKTCLGCAVIKREHDRAGLLLPEYCQECLRDFCVN